MAAFSRFVTVISFAIAACVPPPANPGGPVVGVTRESDFIAASTRSPQSAEKIAAPRAPHETLFVTALRELDLSDEQRRTIENELKALVADAARVGNPAPFSLVAKGVRLGKIDVNEAHASFEANRVKDPAKSFSPSLAALHDTLTQAQRVDLVEKIEKRQAASSREADTGHGAFAPPSMMRMLAGLSLSDDQKDSLAKAFAMRTTSAEERANHEAEVARLREESRKRLHAFVEDSFDATAFMTPPNGTAPTMSRFVDDLSVVVGVLSQEQREKLASKIEQGPISHETPRPDESR